VKKIMALQTTTLSCLYSSFRHYYLCHYLPLSAGKDMISLSLLKFKRRRQPDFNTWIEGALEALTGISPSPDTIILRALHHDETIAAPVFPTALDFLGHALADRFGCRYLPCLLCKSHPARPCKELSRRQRKTELRGIYSLHPAARQMIAPAPQSADLSAIPPAPPPADPTTPDQSVRPQPASPPFLLIDDILTTGTTMRMIIRPLHRTFPLSPIRIFTLARANYDPKLHEPVTPTQDTPTP
jgi:predicted amidophosphoribosyltransferase